MVTEKLNQPQRAVLYVRVGSSRQADISAIARQHEACLRIAEEHGLTIVREYIDVGQPRQKGGTL